MLFLKVFKRLKIFHLKQKKNGENKIKLMKRKQTSNIIINTLFIKTSKIKTKNKLLLIY